MLSIIGNRKIIVSILTMVFLIVGVQGISYAQVVIVDPPSVDPTSIAPGGSFTLTATVRNAGTTAQAPGTINEVKFYRSVNTAIDQNDILVGSARVSSLSAGGEGAVGIVIPAPTTTGSYYYGASVQAGTNGPIDYSTAVTLTVNNLQPNLTVTLTNPYPYNPYGYYNPVTPGGTFTLDAIVTNEGAGQSSQTSSLTIYYRATTSSWTQVTPISIQPSAVPILASGATSRHTVTLSAPLTPVLSAPFTSGTYEYYVSVVPISGESNQDDNDSRVVSIITSSGDLIVDPPTVDKSTLAPR